MKNLNNVNSLKWSLNKVLLMVFGLALLLREAKVLWGFETSCNFLVVGLGLSFAGLGFTLLQPKRFSLVGRLAALCFFSSLCWFAIDELSADKTTGLHGLFEMPGVIAGSLLSLSFIIWGSHPKVIALLEHMGKSEDFWDDGDWD